MDKRDESHGDHDADALLSQRLAATPAASDEPPVGRFRRRRSSGLLFQVRRRTRRAGSGL
ncbi:MAG TPA: hypothetical protein VN973_14310 [Candidatus Dormibacteraeota bacterium]|nr:hypothetical protein [Candidatus Dormibacteraeota bacterium]